MKKQEEMDLDREVDMIACKIFNELWFKRKPCDMLIRVDSAAVAVLFGYNRFFNSLLTNGSLSSR